MCTTELSLIECGTRLRVVESRVLRGMFGPKRDEITGK